MQKHNIKSSLEYSSTPTGDRAGLFHGVTTATQEKCEDKPRRKIENVLHRLKQIPLGLYSYIASNGGMNLLRCSRTLRTSAIISAFALILLATATVVPIYNNISITEAASSYTSSSLSMNVTKSTASVDLSAIRDNGSFASSVNPIAFNITTTNYTGYTLSLKNTKSAKTLVNSTNSNYTLDSITSSVSESAFSADTASAATNYNGKWGYKPSKYNSSNNSNYLSLPTTSGSTLDTTTAANSSANSYTIGIGARANYETAAGTYTGTYTLVAIANNVPYTINYNGNVGTSGDTVGSLPSNTTSTTSEQYITISSNTPTRTGYTFGGWCTNHTTTNPTTTLTNGSTTCPTSATTLSSSGRFYIDQTTNNLTTLYAIWTRKNTTYTLSYNANNGSGAPTSQSNTNNNGSYTFTLNTSTIPTRSGYNFLGYATSSSATTPTYTYTAGAGTNGAGGTFSPSTITLTQPSMSSTSASTMLYAVWEQLTYMQGLSSSQCTTTASEVIDSRDGQKYIIQRLADGKCWLLDNLRLGTGVQLTSSNSNVSSTWTTPSSSTGSGFNSYTEAHINTASMNNTQSYGSGSGKIGVYYNYCAATAGTYCVASNSGSGNASYDICPKGWRMPTGGSSGEYQALYAAYSSNATNFKNALRTPLSGNFSDGSAHAQGSSGHFWSSTYYNYNDGTNMYYLYVLASSANPANYANRINGFPVRCVLEESVKSATYMQDVTADMVSTMTAGQTVTLKDSRDEQSYTVGKLADGRLWLLDNLALDLVASKSILSSSNTNATDAELTYLKNGGGTSSDRYATSGVNYFGSSNSYSDPRIYRGHKDATGSGGYSAGKYGVYYNYCAATAGTYCYGNGASYGSPSGNATADICPYGWRMPTSGNGTGEYRSLYYTAYSKNYANFVNVFHAPLSGGYNGEAGLLRFGVDGRFWSSTYYTKEHMYGLIVDQPNNDVYDGTYYRHLGNSVRCVRAAS